MQTPASSASAQGTPSSCATPPQAVAPCASGAHTSFVVHGLASSQSAPTAGAIVQGFCGSALCGSQKAARQGSLGCVHCRGSDAQAPAWQVLIVQGSLAPPQGVPSIAAS